MGRRLQRPTLEPRTLRWWAGCLLLTSTACTEIRAEGPRISSITPDVVAWGVSSPVTIRGDQLYSFVRVDLDSVDPPIIDQSVRVAINDTWLGVDDVTLVDATRIEIWTPGDLTPGVHDVTVELAPNRSVRRDAALRVEREPSLVDGGTGTTDDAGAVVVTSRGGIDGGIPGAGDAGPTPTVCSPPSQCQPCVTASCFAFDTVRLIEAVSDSAEDDDPSLTADLLELYFNSDRNGVSGIWLSKRASVSEPGVLRSGSSPWPPAPPTRSPTCRATVCSSTLAGS